MKITKRILVVILSMALVIGGLYFVAPKEANADADFAITTPVENVLRAAGYIDIEWQSASNIGNVKNYDVFIDGSLVKTTTGLSYEFYTTKVSYHRVWIRANFTDAEPFYTKTVQFGVTKKGLGIGSGMGPYNCKAKEMNIGWYYNWGTNKYGYPQYTDIEYVPMVWGDTNAQTIRNKVNAAANQGYKYILGFNEPDMDNKGGGCDMATETAISLWPNLKFRDDIRVGSPAYARWGAGSKMVQFMAGVSNDVDYVCLHCYPWNWDGGKGMADWMLKDVIDDAYNRYHKPIWITEYSTSGDEGHITQKGTAEFIKYFLQGLNERDYVERQAFFSFNAAKPGGGLWNYSNGELSLSGKEYAKDGNPYEYIATGTEVNPRDKDEPVTVPPTTTEETSAQPTTKAPAKTTTHVTPKKPAKVSIKKIKYKKKRKVYLKFKKVSGAKGYQIRYSDEKSFDGYWTKTTKKTTITIKKLDKNTKYYFKVRAYKLVNNQKLYGDWSKKKKVKVKK